MKFWNAIPFPHLQDSLCIPKENSPVQANHPLHLSLDNTPSNQNLHLSPITGKMVHLAQAASAAPTQRHQPKSEDESRSSHERSKPTGPPPSRYSNFAPQFKVMKSGAAAVQWLHVQYLKWAFIEKLTPRFPSPIFDLAIHRISIAAPIIPSYHLNLDGHDSKYRERRHGSVQPIPPLRFFHRESRTLHRERLCSRKGAKALGSYRWPSDQ